MFNESNDYEPEDDEIMASPKMQLAEIIQKFAYYNYLVSTEIINVDFESAEERDEVKELMIDSYFQEEEQPTVELLNEEFVPIDDIIVEVVKYGKQVDPVDDIYEIDSNDLMTIVVELSQRKVFDTLNELDRKGYVELCWNGDDFVYKKTDKEIT